MKVEMIWALVSLLGVSELDAGALDAGAADAGVPVESDDEADDALELQVPSRLMAPPLASAKPLPPQRDVLALATRGEGGALWLAGKRLTIDVELQKQLVDIMKLYQTPYAAAVVIEPATGRVLAMAEHSELDPAMTGLCSRPLYPAASIFKLVTAAALLEAGVSPDQSVCFHGGKRRLSAALLEDTSADSVCQSLSLAVAKSSNVAMAKLTRKHLSSELLSKQARALHFNRELSFPVPTGPSLAAIPATPYELALTGAGFGDVFLSPLHGAALAAAIADHGQWHGPVLFEGAAVVPAETAMSAEAAAALTAMMERTIAEGTARRVFRERGFAVPGAVGKTGALADRKPFRDYTWFVGFAPKEAPAVAVAALVVNDPHWRIRAAWLGREAMRLGLKSKRLSPAAVKSGASGVDGG